MTAATNAVKRDGEGLKYFLSAGKLWWTTASKARRDCGVDLF